MWPLPADGMRPATNWSRSCALWAPRLSSLKPTSAMEDDVRAMVDKTVARFGRIDVAVNNAATE